MADHDYENSIGNHELSHRSKSLKMCCKMERFKLINLVGDLEIP
jgi:hypothetical protein